MYEAGRQMVAAIEHDRVDIIHELLNDGYDLAHQCVPCTTKTALMVAASRGSAACLNAIIQFNPDLC